MCLRCVHSSSSSRLLAMLATLLVCAWCPCQVATLLALRHPRTSRHVSLTRGVFGRGASGAVAPQRMATSMLLAGSLAAPRLSAPASPSCMARACKYTQRCTAFAVQGCRRRAPARLVAESSRLAQRCVHRGAQLAIRRHARALKQPQSKAGLVRSLPSCGAVGCFHCSAQLRQTLVAQFGAVQLVQASFLGVGAPEAFVIAIVALLVFGPKGLAEARGGYQKARRVGRADAAATDCEEPWPDAARLPADDQGAAASVAGLQVCLGPRGEHASAGLASSERQLTGRWVAQIGLDDSKSTTTVSAPRPDLDSKLTEEMRRASEAAAWGGAAPAAVDASIPPAPSASGVVAPEPAAQQPPVQPGKLPDLSKLDD